MTCGCWASGCFFFHAHKHTRLTGRNGRSRVTCVCRVVGLYSLLMLSILHKESCRRSDGRDFCTVRRPVVCQSHARSLLHRSLPCVCVWVCYGCCSDLQRSETKLTRLVWGVRGCLEIRICVGILFFFYSLRCMSFHCRPVFVWLWYVGDTPKG